MRLLEDKLSSPLNSCPLSATAEHQDTVLLPLPTLVGNAVLGAAQWLGDGSLCLSGAICMQTCALERKCVFLITH